MLKGMRNYLFNLLVIFSHDDLAMIVDELDYLLDWEGDAIAFELVKDLVDFLPVKTALDVGLAVEAEKEWVDAFEACDD